ncbi:phenylacetate-CoA ligase [Marinobacter daqiaonensis]|uniref:Phenylacetate-CoA ligase n=1 Tax=Marinobacter daqiaonensis TaxID=650891 RepID=A0A1I6HVY7_9GAMM|nr:phenylacetate--CoA ligase family protein [Marinobacter daqiaonensis]SFR58605.1 phenylacetate-CoA ligase [Marinobacter daqiaonensis]
MKSHLPERLYLASPVWLQNLLVSTYGVLEHQRRYGGVYSSYLRHLEENKFKPADQMAGIVEDQLTITLQNAMENVPYYRNLNISRPELSAFPLLERQEVALHGEQFVNEKYKPDDLIALYTGGSSASPLKVCISKAIRQKTYAFWQSFYRGMDFEIGDRKASFVGRKIQEPDDDAPPFWRYNARDRQLVFSSYHMSEENLPHYVRKLNEFQPKIIEGYPLSIYRLAEYIVNNEVDLNFQLTGVSTSSESFSDFHRKTIEKAFACRVFDQYGSAESVVFASECQYGKMHIEPEYGIVEVLTESGELRREGEGELIVTTLLNDAMPLIRYRIGDLGEVADEACQCGRETAVLKQLHGKVGAIIANGDKQVPTAAIAIAFEYLEGIKNAQIIQDCADAVRVKLVKRPDFNPEGEKFMIWELKKMLGESLKITTEFVDDIPPEANGKYKMVVQNYYR